jgi:hypothetical protein
MRCLQKVNELIVRFAPFGSGELEEDAPRSLSRALIYAFTAAWLTVVARSIPSSGLLIVVSGVFWALSITDWQVWRRRRRA